MKTRSKNSSFGLVCFLVALLIVSVTVCCVVSIDFGKKADDWNVITEFSVVDSLPNGNGEKVKIILLNGQSNASGVANFTYLRSSLNASEISTYENGFSNIYINYFCENGNHSSSGKFENVKIGQGCSSEHFGPELGIAKTLSSMSPGETYVILKYSWGGSNLYEQWRAPSSVGKTGEMYEAFINFTRTNMEYLRAKNYNAEIVAMCWMQGESDAFDIGIANAYYDNLSSLVSNARNDLSPYIQSNGMYFIDAGISDSPYWTYYQLINNAKHEFAATNPKNVYIDTVSIGLSYRNEPFDEPDLAHYDSASELLLGELFAENILLIS